MFVDVRVPKKIPWIKRRQGGHEIHALLPHTFSCSVFLIGRISFHAARIGVSAVDITYLHDAWNSVSARHS